MVKNPRRFILLDNTLREGSEINKAINKTHMKSSIKMENIEMICKGKRKAIKEQQF